MDESRILFLDSIPILPGYYAITERLSDKEIEFFLEGLIECKMKNIMTSDCIISNINRSMWAPIWKYRDTMIDYLIEHCNWEE